MLNVRSHVVKNHQKRRVDIVKLPLAGCYESVDRLVIMLANSQFRRMEATHDDQEVGVRASKLLESDRLR